MLAEIICIGDEILIKPNCKYQCYIPIQLSKIGIEVLQVTSISVILKKSKTHLRVLWKNRPSSYNWRFRSNNDDKQKSHYVNSSMTN